jgi:hypothetical protein
LKVIDCSHTKLAAIPTSLSGCSKLEIVQLNGGSELVKCLLRYLQQFESGGFLRRERLEWESEVWGRNLLKGGNRNDGPEGHFTVVI